MDQGYPFQRPNSLAWQLVSWPGFQRKARGMHGAVFVESRWQGPTLWHQKSVGLAPPPLLPLIRVAGILLLHLNKWAVCSASFDMSQLTTHEKSHTEPDHAEEDLFEARCRVNFIQGVFQPAWQIQNGRRRMLNFFSWLAWLAPNLN